MSNKYLRKKEIRTDLNPKHFNRFGKPHDAVITARYGHRLKANTRTHAKYVGGVETLDIEPYSKNKRHERYSPPFWQSEKQFGPRQNKKVPKRTYRKIQRYNKKFR